MKVAVSKALASAPNAPEAALDNTRGHVSQPTSWAGLRIQWRAPLASASLRSCMKKPLKGSTTLTYKATVEVGQVLGAFCCKSPLCFNCGPFKTGRVAEKLKRALLENEGRGGTSTFLTLTIQSGNLIEEQQKLLSSAYRFFAKEVSRKCKKKGFKSGISYSYDATFKKEASYATHLHIHAIWFCSGDAGLSEQELFSIWERAVKRNSHEGYYVSKDAFYAKPVDSGDANRVSKYVAKFVKSALEIANSNGKKCGFRDLVMVAADDANAFRVYNQFLRAFYGLHYSSLGKFASALAGCEEDEEEEAEGEGSERKEEELSITVHSFVHSIICDNGAIVSFLELMKMYSETEMLRSVFVANWHEVIHLLDVEELNYLNTVLLVRKLFDTHLGFRF